MHWNSGATSVNVRYSAAYPTGRKRILVAKMIVETMRLPAAARDGHPFEIEVPAGRKE